MDPRAGRMILRPGKRIDARPVKSTSGILAGFQSGELAVLHIMRGSPAAAAGWQVGERICRIDGQLLPADYLASPLAGWAIGTPGRTVTLELCGGDKRQLTLADFY
jgi:C-terminal processing protease CtpA/Prc